MVTFDWQARGNCPIPEATIQGYQAAVEQAKQECSNKCWVILAIALGVAAFATGKKR